MPELGGIVGRIGISEDNTYFVRDGGPFFYLADTAWMAFEKLSLEEWKEYVAKRRCQGFNVIQISVLPISHDNSEGKGLRLPFGKKADGETDFFFYEEEYFENAEKMLQILRNADMFPCLHLLWANYVPDTWAAKLSPDTVMPLEAVAPFAAYISSRYKKYLPLYSISGDTSFETERVVSYYQEALHAVKKADPDCLITLHLQPGADWPAVLTKESMLDFYAYQGGHFQEKQSNNAEFATQFYNKKPVRPIVNMEPPYEGHGWGYRYGRFGAPDIRQAIWHGILSGAKAGAGYGAHGVWMFHREGFAFNNCAFSDMPYPWRIALEFEGAWDAGWIRQLCEEYGFHRLCPADVIGEHPEMIRAAMSPEGDLLVIYAPYPGEILVKKDLSAYRGIKIDMEKKRYLVPDIACGETSVIHMQEEIRDVLLILEKNN